MLHAAIAEGYRAPANKADQCEHGKYGWEDCIACYDDELAKAAERMRALPPAPQPDREAIARIRERQIEAICQARCTILGIRWDDGMTEGVARIERMLAERGLDAIAAISKKEADHGG